MFLQPLRGREFAANAAENGGKVPFWLQATLCGGTFPIVNASYWSLEVLREMSLKYQQHQFPLTVNTPSRTASLRMSAEEEEEQQAE